MSAPCTLPCDWRLSQGLSQESAARLAGVRGKNPSRTWQRWEDGEQQPPLDVIVEIERRSGGAVTIHSWIACKPRAAAVEQPPSRGPGEKIVAKLGGISAASRMLSIGKSTVQGWKERGFIHPKHCAHIIEAAKAHGIVIEPAEFLGADIGRQGNYLEAISC